MPTEEKTAPVVAAVSTTTEVTAPKKVTDTDATEVITKQLSAESAAVELEKPKNDTVTKEETKEEEKNEEGKTEEEINEEVEKEEEKKEGDKNEEEDEKEGDIVRETESDNKLTETASKSDDGETKTEGVVLRKRRTPEKKESKDEDVSPPKRVK